MKITVDLPDELCEFAGQMSEALEYESIDAFLASLLRRQRESLAAGMATSSGAAWSPHAHDQWRQRIEQAKRKASAAA